jgi:hypothetical protein
VLVSQLGYIISLLVLFALIILSFLVDLSLIRGPAASGLATEVDDLNHILKLEVISEPLKQFLVRSEHACRIRLYQAVQSYLLKFRVVGIEQAKHQRGEAIWQLLQMVCLGQQLQETVEL